MVMDDESYRPPPSKSSAQKKSSKSSSKSASSSIARNRAHRATVKPGAYEIPQMSAPLDMWIRKPSAPKSSLLSRPAHVSAPARLAEVTTPRAAPTPKAGSRRPVPAPRRQRSVSSELSPAPETQVTRPLQRVESSLLSPAPPTPPAPASQRSAKALPAAPSRSRPSTQADPTPRPSQKERQECDAAPAPKSPSPTESPPTDVAPGFDDIDDVLAEYADFAVSPTQSMVSLASRRSINTPRTPRRQPTGSRLSASPLASRTHLPTPARSGANDAPPSSQTSTPAKPRPGMSLTSEIWREHERDLAGEDASREKARMQAEARWERQRRAAALREEMDEEEELDFDLQFLDTLPVPAQEAVDEAQEEPLDARRRSSRGRPTGPKSSATKPDPEEQERLKNKKKEESAFKKLLSDRARDSRRGRGEEAIGAALEALKTPPRGPDHGSGDAAWMGSEATGLELDDDTKAAAQMFMAERSAAASREQELLALTKVFWDERPIAETTPSGRVVLSTTEEDSDPVVELLHDVEDPSTLMAYLTAGILDAADRGSIPRIADWLFATAFVTESTELAWTAVSKLQQIMDTHDPHPFITGERLFKRIESVWASLGARQGQPTSNLFEDGTVQRSRDDASAILCVIIEAAVQNCGKGDGFTEADLEGLILRLFALLAEPSTTATLSQQIAQTIGRTLLLTPTQNIAALAFKAAELVAPLSKQLQARAVLTLGGGTSAVRQLVRWLAISLILPEIRGEKEQPPSAVDMDILQQGLDHIQDLMPDGTTDYWPASDAFTLWSLALGDESEDANGSADDTRRHLNRLLHSIRDKAQEGPAASLKGRMDQLKHVLKLQDDKRQGRRGKQTDATSWLFGEERGQTKLSFAPTGGA
ncbi:uncharacterized protein LOC62_02G002835 [Vanrija pseudolonga]|uniref:Uncharacterized protein n=1 Tax=Vanrija pseudolonga TaxID=143232 RepID=A0AAF1BK80_9TREE|nr:hypothetical protein LOC62_02G002835 [Vanrija pseudolonga]